MKKIFELGNIDYLGTGIANNPVTVEVTFEEKGGTKVFTASGNIWLPRRKDILCGGQCLDTIAEYITDDKVFAEIYRLWNLYHLNDMHAECIHQNELGWPEQAREEVIVYRYVLNSETSRRQDRIQGKIIEDAKKNLFEKLSDEDLKILNLDYSCYTYNVSIDDDLSRYYKLDKQETERRGYISHKANPIGILGKKCPVCGYRYGSSWNCFPIFEEDEKIIRRILNM